MKVISFIVIVLLVISCHVKKKSNPSLFIQILGVAQDAGYPQLGCTKECCKAVYDGKETKKHVVSLALVNNADSTFHLFEATPDIAEQLTALQSHLSKKRFTPSSVFLTHAHIGHYTGLMYFGREAMSSSFIPVYTLPRMDSFLRRYGPWSQLTALNNIELRKLKADSAVSLSSNIKVTVLQVPHRDEFSETAGFIIETKNKKLLFIPDIDKWNKWERSIVDLIKQVDYALLDATFFC